MNIYNDIIKNRIEIADEIIELCKKNDIKIVMPLAKKGKLMLDLLSIKTKIKKNKIQVISDRELNKKGYYEKINRPVLLFDDSIKTGARLKHTKTYLEKKIIDKLLSKNGKVSYKADFFYYALVKCKDIELLDDFEEEKLTCFNSTATISDYYSFCIEETYAFQKYLYSTSMDLPLFSLKVNDIDQLKNDLKLNVFFKFNDTFSNIANKKVSLGVLLVDIPNFLESLKGFAIASTAKIRHEKQANGKYKVIYNPFVICESIKYDELENMYNILFDEDMHSKSKFEMNLQFVKLYRKVIYLLSYVIGLNIKEYLEDMSYEVEFIKNYDTDIDDQFENYSFMELFEKIISKSKDIKYTEVNNKKRNSLIGVINGEIEDQSNTLVNLYDAITYESRHKMLNEYNYNFVEMKELSYLYKKNNIMNFVTAMYQLIENYTTSQEIEFNFANSIVERGFVNGENGDVNLPVERPEVFIKGIFNYYKRVSNYCNNTKDKYNLFKLNYDLFISKFYNILNVEDLFNKKLVLYSTFEYLANYFRNITEEDFVRKIEGKEIYLQNDEEELLMTYIDEKLDLLLLSSDFTFNKKANLY